MMGFTTDKIPKATATDTLEDGFDASAVLSGGSTDLELATAKAVVDYAAKVGDLSTHQALGVGAHGTGSIASQSASNVNLTGGAANVTLGGVTPKTVAATTITANDDVQTTKTDDAVDSTDAPLKSAGGLACAKSARVGTDLYIGGNKNYPGIPFFNDTGAILPKGASLNGFGFDVVNNVIKAVLLDASSPLLSATPIGLVLEDVPDQQLGFAGNRVQIEDLNTSAETGMGPIYADPAVPGGRTNTRPTYPDTIVILGATVKIHAVTGIFLVDVTRFRRAPTDRSFDFTSQGVASGTFYKGGFYDWEAADANLTQASLSVLQGTLSRSESAHVGIVPSGPGSVDAGQVGLQVVGIEDSETGVQAAGQTAIITDDITTLTANVMVETLERFSGQVTIQLYVVSGTPTTYSLDFNYGKSKYEDFFDTKVSITGFEAQWRGGANDSSFNIRLLHHKPTGWTYAATGFVPGNGVICERLTDQQLASDVDSGEDGAYKRTFTSEIVDGGNEEGIILEITTTNNSTIQTAKLKVVAFSEELT